MKLSRYPWMLGGGIRIPYIMRDEFLTDRSAGAINGTAAEPGPSTRTVVDAENKLTISGGQLVCAGGKATPAWGDPKIIFPGTSRVCGLTTIFQYAPTTHGSVIIGFAKSATPSGEANFENAMRGYNTTDIIASAGGVALVNAAAYQPTNGIPIVFSVVLRATGALYLIKVLSSWQLFWVENTTSTGTVYPAYFNYASAFSSNFFRVAALPAPFNTDYGLATQRLAGARTAGDTFSHEANCLIEWTVTNVGTANYTSVAFRQQDVDNRYNVAVASDGSFNLMEKVSGSAVSRGSAAAGSIANGQRMVVIADGSTIRVYANNVLKITYASATYFQAATNGNIISFSTGGAISDLVSWPRTLTGRAAAILNKASA